MYSHTHSTYLHIMLKKVQTQKQIYVLDFSNIFKIANFLFLLHLWLVLYVSVKKEAHWLEECATSFLLFCQIQEAVNMAAELFDCTVPLKVFSFRDNTDYGRIPRVSEAPFQRVTHFRSLLYFNQTTTLNTVCQPFFEKNSRAVPRLNSDLYTLTSGNESHSFLIKNLNGNSKQ